MSIVAVDKRRPLNDVAKRGAETTNVDFTLVDEKIEPNLELWTPEFRDAERRFDEFVPYRLAPSNHGRDMCSVTL